MDWILFLNQFCVFLFFILITQAALTDMQRFIIPNYVSIALIGLYVPFALTCPEKIAFLQSLAFFGIIIVIGFALFALNIIGAGDVKLLAAISLWTTPTLYPAFLLHATILGGVLAIAIAGFYYAKYFLQLSPKPHLKGKKIPYGVAITAAGYGVGFNYITIFNNFSYTGV
jgi:prepilin peptidase CpaA